MAGDDDPSPAGDDDMAADDMAADDAPVGDDDPMPEPVDTSEGMLLADFEAWDGATALPDWSFQYGPEEMPYTAGPFELSDETGEYVLEMVAGHDSQYAISFSNPMASDWGGGVGFWMGATDIQAFSGVSFWVKGSTPGGTMEISLGRPETDEDCADGDGCSRSSVKFDTPAEWTQMSFAWNEFSVGLGVGGEEYTLPAASITAVGFNAHMVYAADASGEYVAQPGAFEITLDDITFY
jgi:hypothetical protein